MYLPSLAYAKFSTDNFEKKHLLGVFDADEVLDPEAPLNGTANYYVCDSLERRGWKKLGHNHDLENDGLTIQLRNQPLMENNVIAIDDSFVDLQRPWELIDKLAKILAAMGREDDRLIFSFTHSRAVELANRGKALAWMALEISSVGCSWRGLEGNRQALTDWIDKYGLLRGSLTDGVMVARLRDTNTAVIWRLMHADAPWSVDMTDDSMLRALPVVHERPDCGGWPKFTGIAEER